MSDSNETSSTTEQPGAQPPAPTRTTDARGAARAGTIIWGVILLVVAALYAADIVFNLDVVHGWMVVVWGALGLGALLVVGGLIAAATRRK